MNSLGRAICFMMCIVAGSVQAAPRYTITRLGLPEETATAALINNSGQIAIVYAPQNVPGAGKRNGQIDVLNGGQTVTLPFPGQYGPGVGGMNNAGHLVGSVESSEGVLNAFQSNGSDVVNLGTLGGDGSMAGDINDGGDIVGQQLWGSQAQGFVLRNDGVLELIPTLGGQEAFAADINEQGLVVGFSSLAGNSGYEAFLYDGSQVLGLGTLGGKSSNASAINAIGEIVGAATPPSGVNRAVLFIPGSGPVEVAPAWFGSAAADINSIGRIIGSVWASNDDGQHAALFDRIESPVLLEDIIAENTGWTRLVRATDINDRSQIVGIGVFEGAPGAQAFLMTPVPEPSRLATLLTGTLVLFLRRRIA